MNKWFKSSLVIIIVSAFAAITFVVSNYFQGDAEKESYPVWLPPPAKYQPKVFSEFERAYVLQDFARMHSLIERQPKNAQWHYLLAKSYFYGKRYKGSDKWEKGYALIKKAVELGSKEAWYDYLKQRHNAENLSYTQHVNEMWQASRKASSSVIFDLAHRYDKRFTSKEEQKKIPPDEATAYSYYLQAAKRGNTDALHLFGTWYQFGTKYFVKNTFFVKSQSNALKYYHAAVARGYYKSYMQMGFMFSKNRKTLKPRTELEKISLLIYKRSNKLTYEEGKSRLAKLAEKGDVRAKYLLGMSHRFDAECEKARDYLLAAYEAGMNRTLRELYYLYNDSRKCRTTLRNLSKGKAKL